MKVFFVLSLISLSFISSSFLRNLAAEITVKSFDFGEHCSTSGTPTSLTLTADSTEATKVLVTLHPVGESGKTNDLVFECTVAKTSTRMRLLSETLGKDCMNNNGTEDNIEDDTPDDELCTAANHEVCSEGGKCVCAEGYVDNSGTCTKEEEDNGGDGNNNTTTTESNCEIEGTAPTAKYGNYTVTAESEGNTVTVSKATGAYFRYDANVTIGANQTKSQTVDSKSSDKKSFTVAFDEEIQTALPRFYAEEKSEKEIPCTLSTDKKTATCTPTNDHMKDGKKYTIYYRTGCAVKGTSTQIEVEYESAAFAKLGSVLLIALVFLL